MGIKKKKKVPFPLLLIIFALLLILILILISCLPEKIIQITTNDQNQEEPVVFGDKIVWTDYRNGNQDIYLYDLATRTEKQITSSPGDEFSPSISGNYIVYIGRGKPPNNPNYSSAHIYLYDLASNTERLISDNFSVQIAPVISEEKIVYQEQRTGKWGIILYDLTTETERWLSTGVEPYISGNDVVWMVGGNAIWQVWHYDLVTDVKTLITQHGGDQMRPFISGRKIVLDDRREGNDMDDWNVYFYDLDTGEERRVTPTSEMDHLGLSISGDNIVWTSAYNYNIYRYNLANSRLGTITDHPSQQYNSFISGNKVVWADYRNGNFDIYLYIISDSISDWFCSFLRQKMLEFLP